MISYSLGKSAKFFLLSFVAALFLASFAAAAENQIAIAVGATTGSSLRLRAEASTSSEVITTLEKSVAVAILDDSNEDWFHISYDGESGFVSAEYLIVDQDNVFETAGRVNTKAVSVRAAADTESELLGTVNPGDIVTINGFVDGWYDVTCKYGTEGYIRSDFVDLIEPEDPMASAIVADAKKYLGTRYVYGGASPSGFDCSGFTMYLYGKQGISLPHSATAQWQSGIGTKIWGRDVLQPGDLIFFNDPAVSRGKACSHVGIYIGNGQFIHASSPRSGGVITSSLNEDYYDRYYVGGIHV